MSTDGIGLKVSSSPVELRDPGLPEDSSDSWGDDRGDSVNVAELLLDDKFDSVGVEEDMPGPMLTPMPPELVDVCLLLANSSVSTVDAPGIDNCRNGSGRKDGDIGVAPSKAPFSASGLFSNKFLKISGNGPDPSMPLRERPRVVSSAIFLKFVSAKLPPFTFLIFEFQVACCSSQNGLQHLAFV